VKYLPALWTNLISITTALKNGSRLSNEGEILVLTKHGRKIKFDRKSRSGEGSTMSVIIEPLEVSLESMNTATNENRRRMYIGDLHRLLGHAGEAKNREAGNNLKMDLEYL
jgi:hypothetical protein